MNNIMIKRLLMLPLAAAVLLTGCAKSEKTNDHETTKRYLDAWVGVNYPGGYSYGTRHLYFGRQARYR